MRYQMCMNVDKDCLWYMKSGAQPYVVMVSSTETEAMSVHLVFLYH
jgi:hypothetical protein